MTASITARTTGIPLPGWLAAVLVFSWLGVMFTRAVHRERQNGATTWRRAFAGAARSFTLQNGVLVGRLILLAAAGYLSLIVLVARRWAGASLGLIVLPLVIVGVVGFRRLGREVAASRAARADAGLQGVSERGGDLDRGLPGSP